MPLVPLLDSVFGRLVGPEAARLLLERAKVLGVAYKTPQQRGGEVGGERSLAAADTVYAAALEILGWSKHLRFRLKGYTDEQVGRTDPGIIAALLMAQRSASGKTPSCLVCRDVCTRTYIS